VDKLITLGLSGAVTGAIYSLVASGIVLSYTATGIFNFSHGAIAYMAAVVFYELHQGLGWPIVPAALMTILVFAPLLGLALDALVFRRLAHVSETARIVATVGLLVALPALTRFVLDSLVDWFDFGIPSGQDLSKVAFPAGIGPVPREEWHIGGATIDSNQLVVLISAALAAVLLWALMQRTSIGLRMRAVTDRVDLARTRGIDEVLTSRVAWVVGMVLAAIAGVVGAPIFGSLKATAFDAVVFVAPAAAVIGGLRSVPWTFVGGLLLGLLQNLVVGYLDFTQDIRGFNASVPFVVLLVGLVLLARDRSRRGGSAAEDAPPPDPWRDLPRWRRMLPWAIAVAFLVVYLGWLADQFWLGVMASGLALSIVFLSFVVVTGLGGMVNLAQAAFVTAAGMTTGMFVQRYDAPWLVAVFAAVLASAAIGILVSLPALRLGGVPLALATLALGFLGDQMVFVSDWVRNGTRGWTIERPVLGPLDLSSDRQLAFVLLALVGIVALLIGNLQRAATGRSIAAVRASELAAVSSGVSAIRTKLGIFAVSAGIAGFGGAMYATYNQAVVATPAQAGLLWLATVVLFGVRQPRFAALAGVVTAISPVILQSGIHIGHSGWDGTGTPEIPAILFGLGAVQLARTPDGFAADMAEKRRAKRAARAERREAARRAAVPAIAAAPEVAGAPAGAGGPAVVVGPAAEPLVPADAGSSTVEAAVGPTDEAAPTASETARAVEGTEGLALRGVRSGYGEIEVLHGIDLDVRPGELVVFLGPNGSGKSTMCSTIAGLIPVKSGTLALDGVDLVAVGPHRRARRGLLVAPEARGIFPGLSVLDNLRVVLSSDDEMEQVFRRFPILGDRRAVPASNLSGGEQQMLTLAPLLVRPPKVLVADEPTLGLAPLIVAELMQVFVELRDRGVAVLLVEEKARAVLDIADLVVLLELGTVRWRGARSDLDEEDLAALYVGDVAHVTHGATDAAPTLAT
jgi:ABC-type branched-subunit amino acid transport system ATPase component/branched-subunit amino acid ABC-type transport system permease component